MCGRLSLRYHGDARDAGAAAVDRLDLVAEAEIDPQRLQVGHPGSIQTSLVGPLSTRSAWPSGFARSNSSCSRVYPPVRALISRARAATSVRVRPSARYLA